MRYAVVLTLVFVALAGGRSRAHEIPNEVTIQTFLRPEGTRLVFLVRAPLKAMREMDVPLRGPGYVDLAKVDPVLRDAATQWIADFVKLYENGQPLPYPEVTAARIALPGNRSFDAYETALAHISAAPLPIDTDLMWSEGLLDVQFTYAIQSDKGRFAISPGLTRLGQRVNVVMRFQMPGGVERAFDVHGDPGIVELDPRWHQAAFRFVKDGYFHILDGTDHLLFLFGLVIPFRRIRSLIIVVTSFTLAHSVTLIASAYNLAPDSLWFPPFVETLIAVSIVYMAFENIVSAARSHTADAAVTRRALERRWAVAFGFGLIHGFGFSFALRESLQFAGSHLLTSLLSFNVGVELGQILVLAILVPLLNLLFRFVIDERLGTILLSALVAHTGWHWAIDRGTALLAYPWPQFDTAMMLAGVRLLMVIVAATAVAWVVFGVLLKRVREPLEE